MNIIKSREEILIRLSVGCYDLFLSTAFVNTDCSRQVSRKDYGRGQAVHTFTYGCPSLPGLGYMAAIETSSFPKSEYNCPTKRPKYSNISSRSSDLHARSSPELQGVSFSVCKLMHYECVSFQTNSHVAINRTDCGSI